MGAWETGWNVWRRRSEGRGWKFVEVNVGGGGGTTVMGASLEEVIGGANKVEWQVVGEDEVGEVEDLVQSGGGLCLTCVSLEMGSKRRRQLRGSDGGRPFCFCNGLRSNCRRKCDDGAGFTGE
ncbi:hypothetical protein L6452_37091 [Arctium lappa]|uniref:Uncharacterized protein n=1 Tax=Arctium lappa TaxID=4217 RepID=A0ACB8Y2Q4_ARCLA|nr:hypothetical protein L6452_37091 [Arctium lappa]